MYKFESEAYNNKLRECFDEYEGYRQMFLEETDFLDPHAIIRRLQKLTPFFIPTKIPLKNCPMTPSVG